MFDLAVGGFQPELIIFVAGADPYVNDQLGGLSLSMDGMKQRDRTVFETALRHGAPVAVTLAGGYAVDLEDTIELHVNTVIEARDALALGG
jgi:acetoin utilization deacetylase AcuC-like enzyme